MNKILGAFALVIAMMFGVAAPATAATQAVAPAMTVAERAAVQVAILPNAYSVYCYQKLSSTSIIVKMVSQLEPYNRTKRVDSHMVVAYKVCRYSTGTITMRPVWTRVTEYYKIYCPVAFTAGYNGTKYTYYFWDNHAGVNKRMTTFSTSCSKSGISTRFVQWSSRSAPLLYNDKDNGPPKWRVRLHADWRLGTDGYASTAAVPMRP